MVGISVGKSAYHKLFQVETALHKNLTPTSDELLTHPS